MIQIQEGGTDVTRENYKASREFTSSGGLFTDVTGVREVSALFCAGIVCVLSHFLIRFTSLLLFVYIHK